MKALSWNDITVEQFQDVYRLSLSQDLDDITKTERVICIMFGLTEQQCENLPMPHFRQLAAQCAFLMTGQIPGKPRRTIKAAGRRYRVVYNPEKLKHRQYVEIMHFGDNPIDNMHLAMASLVNPITWYGKELKNNADDHQQIADDLRQARVIDVYHSCVFFLQSLREFNRKYQGLFGISDDEGGDEPEGGDPVVGLFTKRFGWMYSTREVAVYERITVGQAYELPVIYSLNILSYLKAKRQHDEELLRQYKRG